MRKPKIIVSKADHERLFQLANGLLERKPEIAEELIVELERARVADAAPRDTVQMGSSVEFESDDGQTRKVTLVYPADADIAEGRISILTPIGTALLGLATGQTIGWVANDGRSHKLTVQSVRQEVATEPL